MDDPIPLYPANAGELANIAQETWRIWTMTVQEEIADEHEQSIS